MSCETETTNIDDREYSVTQWAADRSMVMKFKLIKAIGASFAILSAPDSDKNTSVNVSDAIALLFQNNSPDEIADLIKSCVVGAACDGKKITTSSFNEIFSGDKLINVYKVFLFVLRVNYSNLLEGQVVQSHLAKLKATL